jgi:flagellar basal body-associated protein FliL
MSEQKVDKKQMVIIALLVVAVVLSLASIAISISLSTSFPEFNFISQPGDSAANVGLTIIEPQEIENEIR